MERGGEGVREEGVREWSDTTLMATRGRKIRTRGKRRKRRRGRRTEKDKEAPLSLIPSLLLTFFSSRRFRRDSFPSVRSP